MATKPQPSELEQEDVKESPKPVNLDKPTPDDPEVNIAVIGKVGSGKTSFVSVILGLDKNEEQTKDSAKKTSKNNDEGNTSTSYSHPENPKINFSILTRQNGGSKSLFEKYLSSIETESFDVFLIFTADTFSIRDVEIAKKIANKSCFFIRTKFDWGIDDINHRDLEEELLTDLRASLNSNAKVFDTRKCEIHLISNLHPYKLNFSKLMKAIADALPESKSTRFRKIPQVEELIALEKFHQFLKEVEAKERDVTKIFPSVKEIKQLFVGSGIAGVQRAMNEKLNQWKEVKINLAIIGNSGAGKSSFINAIREVEDDDERSAATTGVVETTRVPTPFEHPTNPNIRFWDLPGIGTPNYKTLQTFCAKVAIETYDTFLIICSKRFTNNDLLLAEKIQSMSKSFFFVRTKVDCDIRAEGRKKGFDEEKTLKELKEDCLSNLKGFNYAKEKIFLISSFDPDKWDFDRLKKAILDQLPSKQKESLTFSMRSYSKDMVHEKFEILRSRIWMVAAASVISKLTLGPFSLLVDGKLIREKVKFYSEQMEFPNPESEEFEMLSEDLQKGVKKFYPVPDQDICEWLKSFDRDNAFNIRKRGKLLLTNKPMIFVYRLLNLILNEMEETALCVVSEAAVRGDTADSDSD